MEDILLDLVSRFQILYFQEASSLKEQGNIEIAFVEGTVSTEKDLKHLLAIRDRSSTLVAIGNCATDGGIQSMRNDLGLEERLMEVYGIEPGFYDVKLSKPLAEYVKVDYSIPGCPIEKEEILRGITSILHGDSPQEYTYPVCVECKRNEYPCVIVEENKPCLGPVITAGCKARCPGLGIDCIGCRGPVKDKGNFAAELQMLLDRGYTKEHIMNRLRIFSGTLPNDFLGGEN
jgi:sulfhydrogenase subunit delta